MGFETIDIKSKRGEQAIKIPKKMKINDNKVYLKKVGNSLFIIPFHNPWENMIESVETFTADYMETREQPDNQNRESLD